MTVYDLVVLALVVFVLSFFGGLVLAHYIFRPILEWFFDKFEE